MNRLLLGQDHDVYGEATTVAVGTRSAAAISVGGDLQSPSLRFKGDGETPNEDALCVVDNGGLVAMVVADAHFGHESSATLVQRAHAALVEQIPRTPSLLAEMIASLDRDPHPDSESESTFLIAVFDRSSGRGFATSFGDSTLAIVSAAGEYRRVNHKDDRYVAAGNMWVEADGSPSAFSASEGDMLLMFTDGVDECHYRHPATSVRAEDIIAVVQQAAGEPDLVAAQLAQLALDGVDGNPGGQDNIAIIAVLA